MSILLDALRKSEEQRRLGATPTLQTPESTVGPQSGGHRKWVPALMMALAAVAIAWIGATQFHLPQSTVVPAAVVIDSQPTAVAAPVVTDSQPADVPIRAKSTRKALNKRTANPHVRPATTPVKDFTAKPQAADVSGSSAENAAAAPAGQAVRGAPVPVEEPIAALAADLKVSDVAARPESDQLEPYATEPISYWQIPQSLRESMPEMRITVLVYAENPADRFLLINGKRLREKSEVSDGLVVEEIQRDRAIFTFRDYRFQLKN